MSHAGIYFLKDSVQDCREILKILRKRRRQSELVTDAMEDLSKLKEKLCFKIDDKTEKMEALKALPKASLPVFNSDKPDSYLDFRACIEPQLLYGNEQLNLSTLLNQIRGSKKDKVLETVRHKMTVEEVFSVLDRKYGSIDVSQAQLLRDLKKLPQYPKTEEDELSNINAILLYTDLAARHKRTKQFINQPFIWEM